MLNKSGVLKTLRGRNFIEIYLKLKYNQLIMRASQWFIFGIAFMILGIILANISSSWQIRCNYEEVIMTNIISCIRANTFAPFPYIFLLLGPVCFINGAIELWSKKK